MVNELAVGNEAWRKSSYCDTSECVEVGRSDLESIVIRDSGGAGAIRLRIGLPEWKEFISRIRNSEF
jgi:hypothetical protein